MKRIYLILAVLGFILAYAVIGAYLLGSGPELGVLFERFLSNQIGSFSRLPPDSAGFRPGLPGLFLG